MASKTYAEKLRDPRWQRLRLEVMQRAKFACEKCSADDRTLNVHHKIYRKGADPWQYETSELECLCEDCHEEKHELIAALNEAVALLDHAYLEELVGYAEALAAKFQCIERVSTRSPMHVEGLSAAFGADDTSEVYGLVGDDKKIALEALWELWDARMKR
jgi:hypothetical protein